MLVLVACEESQRVCVAFRNRGHKAFSCDLQMCSGGHPEWHIKGDCLPLLNGRCTFETCDGVIHYLSDKWDLIIAHPPCTYLCRSGMHYCNVDRYGQQALSRLKLRDDALQFFIKIANADCEKICIENPIGYVSDAYKKPTQIVQPLEFGDAVKKSTCLWLKGLPPLQPTQIVPQKLIYVNGRYYDEWFYKTMCIRNNAERSRIRSVTFPGIANAMATQWG